MMTWIIVSPGCVTVIGGIAMVSTKVLPGKVVALPSSVLVKVLPGNVVTGPGRLIVTISLEAVETLIA